MGFPRSPPPNDDKGPLPFTFQEIEHCRDDDPPGSDCGFLRAVPHGQCKLPEVTKGQMRLSWTSHIRDCNAAWHVRASAFRKKPLGRMFRDEWAICVLPPGEDEIVQRGRGQWLTVTN